MKPIKLLKRVRALHEDARSCRHLWVDLDEEIGERATTGTARNPQLRRYSTAQLQTQLRYLETEIHRCALLARVDLPPADDHLSHWALLKAHQLAATLDDWASWFLQHGIESEAPR